MQDREIEMMVDRLIEDSVLQKESRGKAIGSLRLHWADQVADIWSVDDILADMPWLNRDQAVAVLYHAYGNVRSRARLSSYSFLKTALFLGFLKPEDWKEEDDNCE